MKKIVILFILFFGIGSLFAIDDVKVELQFFAQTYRLNDPILVVLNVVNQSDEFFGFDVSPLVYESFFFEIKTPKNETIKLSDDFKVEIRNNYASTEDYRNIQLDTGESFARQIDISKWFDIKESGYYYIRGQFYANPDIRRHPQKSIYYKILVKPPLDVEQKLSESEQKRLSTLEMVKKLPPYEAIVDMIDAKMKKDWRRFLAHIDSKRLVMSFQNFASDYKSARTGNYRLDVIKRFEKYLTIHWQDRIINYTLKKTEIEGNEATVICDIKYKVRQLSYTLRYVFELHKNHKGHWLVYNYTATRVE